GRLFLVGFTFALEERGHPIQNGRFPGADLVGMDVVFGGDLGEGFLFLERFLDDFGFESRRVSFSHGSLSLTYFRPCSCPDFLGHYITPPPSRCWAMTKEKMDELDAQGRIHWPLKDGGMPRLKFYEDEAPGVPLKDMWTDVRTMHNLSAERLGYPTQKP